MLTACATQRCDPRLDTDPFSTIGCSVKGGYDQAVRSAQNDVNLSRQILTEQQRRLNLLNGQQAQLRQELQANQAALTDMETQLAVINRQLDQGKGETAKLRNKQAQIKRQINSLKTRNTEQERALAAKKKQVEDINKAINN